MIHCVSTQNASQVTQGTIAITKQSKAGRPPTFLSAQKSMLTPEELAGDAGKSSITDGRVGRLWLALTSVVNGNGCSWDIWARDRPRPTTIPRVLCGKPVTTKMGRVRRLYDSQ